MNNAGLLSYLQGLGVPTDIIQQLAMGSANQPMQLPVNQQMPMAIGMPSQTPQYAGPQTAQVKFGGGGGGGSGGGAGGLGGMSGLLGMF